jgi:hypothetical protein
MVNNLLFKALLLYVFINPSLFALSQKTDSTKIASHFGGAVTVTNKGISIIPNLTLGKPAAIFEMSVGRKLSFEPQFRFALEGKPWSFIFWWRYEVINTKKFLFKIGAHPAIAFRTITDSTDGTSREILRAQRYLAGELSPTYSLGKNLSIGLYYLYAHGIEEDITQHTNYLGFKINFVNIKLSNQFYMRFYPQIYYLNMDKKDGYYFNATLTLAMRNFPLSVSSLINKNIQTEIPAEEDFIWNVSLIYTFNKNYVEAQ